jgi:hypothetical protein
MEAKTKDGHTTITMTDTEADDLYHELRGTELADATWKVYVALQEDGRD